MQQLSFSVEKDASVAAEWVLLEEPQTSWCAAASAEFLHNYLSGCNKTSSRSIGPAKCNNTTRFYLPSLLRCWSMYPSCTFVIRFTPKHIPSCALSCTTGSCCESCCSISSRMFDDCCSCTSRTSGSPTKEPHTCLPRSDAAVLCNTYLMNP